MQVLLCALYTPLNQLHNRLNQAEKESPEILWKRIVLDLQYTFKSRSTLLEFNILDLNFPYGNLYLCLGMLAFEFLGNPINTHAKSGINLFEIIMHVNNIKVIHQTVSAIDIVNCRR